MIQLGFLKKKCLSKVTIRSIGQFDGLIKQSSIEQFEGLIVQSR